MQELQSALYKYSYFEYFRTYDNDMVENLW